VLYDRVIYITGSVPSKSIPNPESAAKLVTPAPVEWQVFFFFFFTLVTGPRRSLRLKRSDTRVYEPHVRARLKWQVVEMAQYRLDHFFSTSKWAKSVRADPIIVRKTT